MLNLFPALLDFQILGITLIRIAVGIMILLLGIHEIQKQKVPYILFFMDALQVAGSICIILGFFTQPTAFLLFGSTLFQGASVIFGNPKPDSRIFLLYIFLALMLLALPFTGPGIFGFDLPL